MIAGGLKAVGARRRNRGKDARRRVAGECAVQHIDEPAAVHASEQEKDANVSK